MTEVVQNTVLSLRIKLTKADTKHCFELADKTDKGRAKHCFELVDKTDRGNNIYLRQGDADLV